MTFDKFAEKGLQEHLTVAKTNDDKNAEHLYGGPQGQHKNISSSTTIYIPVQQHMFQYNNIYSSTKIYFPVQQYIFQYKNMFSSTTIHIPVQKYLF